MEQIIENKIIQDRNLRYEFSEEEIQEMGEDLSRKVLEYEEKEDEKKAVAKTYSNTLKHMMKGIIKLSHLVDNGFEERSITCEIEYNHPMYGQKTIRRRDTFESWVEQMTDDEVDQYGPNLFNQAVDDFDSSFAEEATVIEESKRLELPSWEEEE